MERNLPVKIALMATLALESVSAAPALAKPVCDDTIYSSSSICPEIKPADPSTLPHFNPSPLLFAQLGIREDDPDKDETIKSVFSNIFKSQIESLNRQFDKKTIGEIWFDIWGISSVNGYVFDARLGDKRYNYADFDKQGENGVFLFMPQGADMDFSQNGDCLVYQINDLLFVPIYKMESGVYIDPETGILTLVSVPHDMIQAANMFSMEGKDKLKNFTKKRIMADKIKDPIYTLRLIYDPLENTVKGVLEEKEGKTTRFFSVGEDIE